MEYYTHKAYSNKPLVKVGETVEYGESNSVEWIMQTYIGNVIFVKNFEELTPCHPETLKTEEL